MLFALPMATGCFSDDSEPVDTDAGNLSGTQDMGVSSAADGGPSDAEDTGRTAEIDAGVVDAGSASMDAGTADDVGASDAGASSSIAIEKFACGTSEVATQVNFMPPNAFFIDGWTHTFVDSRFEGDAYALDVPRSDSTCASVPTLQRNLVKRFDNWANNHVNGYVFLDGAVPVETIEALVIELRVHRAKTAVPSPADVEAAFKPIMDQNDWPFDAASLDGGHASFLFVLEQLAGDDVTLEQTKAKFLLTISPDDYDTWIRYVVPIESMEFFVFQNFLTTPSSVQEAIGRNVSFKKGLFTAESESEVTLRNVVYDQDPVVAGDDIAYGALNFPLVVADQAVSIKKIGLVRNR
ncbi:MAG: hypothetical protein AAFN74_12930 [Myxococcota bacterium]